MLSDVEREALRGRAERDLEWPRLMQHIAGHALGSAASGRLRVLRPKAERSEALVAFARIQSALALAEDESAVPAVRLAELTEVIGRARIRGALGGEELCAVRDVLAHARALRRYAKQLEQQHAELATALLSEPSLDGAHDVLAQCLTDDGDVADAASPVLARARRAVQEYRRELSSHLRRLVTRYSDSLSQQYSTEREGRPVLPVRSDAPTKVPGMVLGSSASGATLFVEPAEVSELANRLLYTLAEVERERERVLRRLSDLVADQIDELDVAYEACVTADELHALTSWARQAKAVALAPSERRDLNLLAMRHPLLLVQGVDVVQNDVALESGQALVISGPNAGGKTVALKCLGLAAWMVRAGVPVPADPRSEVGFFAEVLTDMADDQSLSMNLSTFSAHLTTLSKFLELASPKSLVLLDEVCIGTDPEEGAALAVAIVEALVQRGAAVGVTTHYERLKEHAAENARFRNASVGLEVQTFAPTFRLDLGVPGPSSALLVAPRFGIAPEIVARAEALVPEHALRRESVLRELSVALTSAAERERALSEELWRQRELRQEMEDERQTVREQERRRLMRDGAALAAEVRDARSELRRVMQQLKSPAPFSKAAVKVVERALDKAAHPVAIGGKLARLSEKTSPPPAGGIPLAVGARAHLSRLGVDVEVLDRKPTGEVQVLAGTLKLWTKESDLVPLRPNPSKQSNSQTGRNKASKRKSQAVDGFIAVRVEANTLDLRGVRVEDGLEQVERFVDSLLRRGERAGYVLHGHGTGAMKAAVREHLPGIGPVVRSEAATREDGGDAFTIFYLE
jgi:DNA mismatch repair protein MutS2